MKRIREIRKKKGLSQRQLEKMTGVSRNIISHYETRTKHFDPAKLTALAQALAVSTDYLLENDSNRIYCKRCGNYFMPMDGKNIKDLNYCPYCGDKNFTKEKLKPFKQDEKW